MRKLYLLLFCLNVLAGNAQGNVPLNGNHHIPQPFLPPTTNFEPSTRYPLQLSRAKHTSDSRSENFAFYMDYGLLDSFYMVNGPDKGNGAWYRDDQYSFLNINTRAPVDSVQFVKYAFTWFPRIIDFVNNPSWPFNEYPPNDIQMTIDTIYVTTGHLHLSDLNDTIIVSIWDYDAFLDSGYTFANGVDGFLLGADTIIVDSSILGGNGMGNTQGVFMLGTYPFSFANNPVVVPQGHRFIIQFNFYGPYNDQFIIGSARRNDCNQVCGASIPYVNATYGGPSQGVDSFNSLYGERYVNNGDTGVFPVTYFFNACGDSVQIPCEDYFAQDLDIFPNIKAVISQFYLTVDISPGPFCPNSNVTVAASAGGSTATPYTYNWRATSGNLSADSGEEVTLTTGNTINNDTVIITVTGANNQSIIDTLLIPSGGITVEIKNNPQPVEIACNDSAIITTRVSGQLLGINYIWSTGDQGSAQSTIKVKESGIYSVTVSNYYGCSASVSLTVNYTGTSNNVSFELPSEMGENQWADCELIFKNTSQKIDTPWIAILDPLGDGSDNVTVYNGKPYIHYIYANPGTYTVTLTMDSAGCLYSATRNITITTGCCYCNDGIASLSEDPRPSLDIFPNPTADKLNITATGFIPEYLSIYDVDGRKLSEQTFTKQIDISELPAGVYFIEVMGGNEVLRSKVVKM